MKYFNIRNLGLGIPFILLIATRLLGFEGVYGQDAYEYARYTKAISQFFYNGIHPGDYFWPVLYPFLGSFFHLIMPVSWALQLVSLLSFLGIYYLLRRILQADFSSVPSRILDSYLLIAICLSPYFLRASILCMSDMLAAFCTFLVYYAFWLSQKNKPWGSLLFICASAAAVATRYAAVVVIFPLALAWIYNFYRLKKLHIPHLLGGIILAIIPLAAHIWLKGANLEFAGHDYLNGWSVGNMFSRNFSTIDGVNNYLVPNILYALSPLGHAGYFLLGLPIVFVGFLQNKLGLLKSLIWLFIIPYLIFLAGIPFQNHRFFVIVFPLVVLALFPLFAQIEIGKWFAKSIIIFAVLQVGVFSYSFSKFSSTQRLEKKVCEYLHENANDKRIYTMSLDVCFEFYGVENEVSNIFSNYFEHFEPGAYFLANPEWFSAYWKDQNPGKNWQKAQDQHLELITEFEKGWKLYVVH